MSQVSQFAVSVTPTVSNGVAYASGDTLGSVMTVADVCGNGGERTIELREIVVTDADTQAGDVDVYVFNENPSSSTTTDNAAFALHASDVAKLQTVITIRNHFTPKCSTSGDVARLVTAGAANAIYCVAVIRAAKTYTSTTAVTFRFKGIWDA